MLYFLFSCFTVISSATSSCMERSFGENKFVCVCNETFCDELEMLDSIPEDHAALYETNKAGARFRSTIVPFSSKADPGSPVVKVNRSLHYQEIKGFGGAFTDSAGMNIESLPPKLQEQVLIGYFSEKGLSYNMGRIPMASTDFSTRAYSYDDTPGDFRLKHFHLAEEDRLYKIPFIQRAASMVNSKLLLIGSPWSAPVWMRNDSSTVGNGSLMGNPGGKYYQTWAHYFVRFLQEYRKNNITLWGITVQNEGSSICQFSLPPERMCFPPEKQRDFIKLNLGPSLKKAGYGVNNLKLMILDDSRYLLPRWVEVVLNDTKAAQFVSGIAFHWYINSKYDYEVLDFTYKEFSNVFFLSTEASIASLDSYTPRVDLGSFDRAECYAHDIIQNLLHWTTGWIDWNLALDEEGGPNRLKNCVDSPIIINAKAKEFYKQPMYYALAQFSKCLPRGSLRIAMQIPDTVKNLGNFSAVAFHTPQEKSVLIAVNRNDFIINFTLYDITKGYLKVTVSAHGIQSYIW